MMSEPHPALKAQFLIFCGFTGYEYFYPNGAYRKVCILEAVLDHLHCEQCASWRGSSLRFQGLVEKWLEGTVPKNYTALIAEVWLRTLGHGGSAI